MRALQCKIRIYAALIAVLFFACQGCAIKPGPVCTRNGKAYGVTVGIFTGSWDDYYERALSYMEGQCYEAALADFDEALKQNPRDARMARTYGMHFIDYFPHREKGLVHFLTGELDAAKEELEVSLGQEKSEKAYHYLDRVRGLIFERQGRSPSVPSIAVHSPSGADLGDGRIWTAADPVVVSGIAWDEQFVSEIAVNAEPLFMEASTKRVSFEKRLRLEQGDHEIRVFAKNLMNGEEERTLSVRIDRAGPAIVVKNVVPGGQVSGEVCDEAGVLSLEIDGRKLNFTGETKVPFFHALHAGAKSVSLLARDRLGNATRAEMDASEPIHAQFPVLLAMSMGICSSDEPGIAFASRAGRKAPEIRVNGWNPTDYSFRENILVDGVARGERPIASVSVNGVQVPLAPGPVVFFSHPLILGPGENTVEILASDENGAATGKKVDILLKTPQVFRLEHRYGILMHPFDGNEPGTGPESFQTYFLKGMIDRKRFRMVAGRDLAAVFSGAEWFRDAGLSENRAGKRFDAALSGVVYHTVAGVEIVARLVERSTSKTIAIEDVYAESRSRSNLGTLAGRLCEKLVRGFPLAVGTLSEDEKGRIVAEIDRRLKMGWPMILFRYDRQDSDDSPADSAPRGYDSRIVGDARIVELMEKGFSVGLAKDFGFDIRNGDKIINR